MKKKIVMVLGATGFLGSHVCKILSKSNKYKIVKASISKGQDFSDYKKTKKFFNKIKPDVVLNCASFGGSVHHVMKNPALVIKNNMLILINLYECASKMKKKPFIVNALANCSYPHKLNVQKEKRWLDGPVHNSVYSFGNITRMKYFVSKGYFDQHKVKSINLIFGGIYGPGDHLVDDRLHAFDGIILRMSKAKLANSKYFSIWGSGKPIREWIYVKDAAMAMVKALKIKKTILEPINVSQKLVLSINKIANVTKKALGFNGIITHDNSFQDGAYKKVLAREKSFLKNFPKFTFTKFDVAVKNTVKYYLSELNGTKKN